MKGRTLYLLCHNETVACTCKHIIVHLLSCLLITVSLNVFACTNLSHESEKMYVDYNFSAVSSQTKHIAISYTHGLTVKCM